MRRYAHESPLSFPQPKTAVFSCLGIISAPFGLVRAWVPTGSAAIRQIIVIPASTDAGVFIRTTSEWKTVRLTSTVCIEDIQTLDYHLTLWTTFQFNISRDEYSPINPNIWLLRSCHRINIVTTWSNSINLALRSAGADCMTKPAGLRFRGKFFLVSSVNPQLIDWFNVHVGRFTPC